MERVYSIPQIQSILAPILARYDVKRAVLFGSYGKACATSGSDIDLLVDSGLRGLRFVGLSEDVRQALGKEVDILDVSHIEPDSRIDHEIRATGVTVYEK